MQVPCRLPSHRELNVCLSQEGRGQRDSRVGAGQTPHHHPLTKKSLFLPPSSQSTPMATVPPLTHHSVVSLGHDLLLLTKYNKYVIGEQFCVNNDIRLFYPGFVE